MNSEGTCIEQMPFVVYGFVVSAHFMVVSAPLNHRESVTKTQNENEIKGD